MNSTIINNKRFNNKMEGTIFDNNADILSIDTLALEEGIQKERITEISELNQLSKKVCYLHTSLLYYRNNKSKVGSVCYEAWRSLVTNVGGTPNGWSDLGRHLGLAQNDLDYIRHSVKEDPTDVVLKLFMQDDDKATLDKILDALVKMKRYDILKKVDQPLTDLATCFKKEDNKSDTGYHSNSKECSEREIVSLPKNVTVDLPPALNRSIILKEEEPKQPSHLQQRPAVRKVKEVTNDIPILLLTYTEDGLETALNIQDKVNNWSDDLKAVAITLNDRKEDVLQNPEKFIREYFKKAHYIVPIITPGYLEEIKSCRPVMPSTTDNLDCKYANFIYNLIVNHYMHVTGCLNIKVRSVLPNDADVSVVMNISMYPDLMPWTHELSFDEQFKCFLKRDRP